MKNRIHKKKLNDLKAIMGCLALDRSGLHAGTYLLLASSFWEGASSHPPLHLSGVERDGSQKRYVDARTRIHIHTCGICMWHRICVRIHHRLRLAVLYIGYST